MAADTPAAFFSYCRKDSGFALRLAEDLKAAGANVWMDQLDIVGGEQWDRAVEAALNNSPRVLVVLSPASVNSNNVLDEISFALRREKTVIPALYRDCDIPLRLERFHQVDFRGDYAHGLNLLLKALGVEQPVQATATAPVEAQQERGLASALEEERKVAEEKASRAELERKVITTGEHTDGVTASRSSFRPIWRIWTKVGVAAVLLGIMILALILDRVAAKPQQQASMPSRLTLIGSIMPPPEKAEAIRIMVQGQKDETSPDDLGRFKLTVNGKAGDRVRLQIYINGEMAYDDFQVLPGPTMINLLKPN